MSLLGPFTPDLLGIYLNDHLAGATMGTELFHRAARSQRSQPHGDTLARLAIEITEDRDALLRIMRRLDIPVRTYKTLAGWTAEKAGRLKFNGHLLTRSPLSSVVELEGMRLGVVGKAAGWRALRTLAESDGRLHRTELDSLISRADRQSAQLEELRLAAFTSAVRPEGAGE